MKKFKFLQFDGEYLILEGLDPDDACQRIGLLGRASNMFISCEDLGPKVSGDIQVHVVKATVVQIGGLDECTLTTDLVGTMWPAGTPVSFRFSLQIDTGAQWILDHFGIEAEVVVVTNGYGSSKP